MAVQTTETYCPICGKAATDPAYNRFGELACSEAHTEEFVKEVRDQKVRAHATGRSVQNERLPRQMSGG
jgi:hypothetical protein